MELIRRLFKEVFLHKKTVALLLVLMLFAVLFDLGAPFIAQDLIDSLVGTFTKGAEVSLRNIIAAAFGIFGVTIFANIFSTMYDLRLFTFVTALEDQLRFRAYERYLSLHVLYHHNANSGQIIGRIDQGASGVYEILRDIIGKFILQPAFVVVLITGILFYKEPLMGLLIVAPIPLFIGAIIPLARKIYDLENKAHDIFEAFHREEYDVATNVLTVKNFAQEHRETSRQREVRLIGRSYQYSAERYWKYSELLQTAIGTVSRVGVIIVGGYLTLAGRSTVGEFVLYITLQNMAYQPLWQLSVLFAILRKAMARAERLFRVLDEVPHIVDAPNAAFLKPLRREIEFRGVAFSYRREREVLKSISVRIPAGTVCALVGRSGSGKSTFVNLLLRSFDPSKGSVHIDGVDIRMAAQKSLRNQMAIVSQDVQLFSRTIGDNIAYGRPNASQQTIVEAAKRAYAHDFIVKLPDGYSTAVGERGIKLSGGERQRIGIARALLKNPRILILDEATSHLDTESERIVQRATTELMKGRTTIVIAHRLSTILHADKILVFDHGELKGEGRHEELLKTNEIYKRLYNLQFEE